VSGEPERIRGYPASSCTTLKPWSWDGVDFEILHPAAEHHWKGNNASCVLRVANSAGSILLVGDIKRRVESRLVASMGDRLDADIVVVPHHGSKTSSSLGFVHRVSPIYALASSGYRSRHGFPRKEVVARWEGSGATLFTTAESGTIEFRLSADGVLHMPTRLRHLARRYWMD
jgi:competence protein ComEC